MRDTRQREEDTPLKDTQLEKAEPELTDTDVLSPKQERALRALISCPSTKEAAREAGISETTLWRYTRDEAFSRRLKETLRVAVSHAGIRLQSESGEAVAVMSELMRQKDAPASIRLSAARSIIDYTIRVGEMDELRRRVDELEEFIRAQQEEKLLDAAALRIEAEGLQ
jgi:AcrR family transcriptional regulator